MLAERFGSHFSQKGRINLISWPDCYILKDASLDNYISMTYVRHLSSLTSDIFDNYIHSHSHLPQLIGDKIDFSEHPSAHCVQF